MGRLARHVSSKWKKTLALLKNSRVRPYVPDTRLMTARALAAMLSKYGTAYAKPVSGTHGRGVIRVERRAQDDYRLQEGKTVRAFGSFARLYGALQRRKANRRYLVQRGIDLLRHNGRPFDVRVMVQRNPKRQWETTGIIARVAERGKAVTNYHNGGTPMRLGKVLAPVAGGARAAACKRQLAKLGVRAAAALGKTYPRVDSIGADIGIDRRFRPWIIELNTSPDPYIFRHLKDARTYRKIIAYARALGRIPPKVRKSAPRGGVRRRKRG